MVNTASMIFLHDQAWYCSSLTFSIQSAVLPSRRLFSVWRYYRRAFAQGGRMIVENDCLILQIFQMDDGETREEVPNGCDDPPAGRTRGTAGASQPRGTGCTDRASHARRW